MIWKNTLNSLLALSVIMALTGWNIKEGKPTPSEQLVGFSQQFEQLQVDIREYNVSPDSAARAFQVIMRDIRQTMNGIDSCQESGKTKFVYPVRGYQPQYSIGGRGRGYRDKNFNLFDMEVHGSHPAHDLFIRDGNQDNLDDRLWPTRGLTLVQRRRGVGYRHHLATRQRVAGRQIHLGVRSLSERSFLLRPQQPGQRAAGTTGQSRAKAG